MPPLTIADCLPHGIWTAISILVASDSVYSLCALRLFCRATRDAGHENLVLASVSIPCPIDMATIVNRSHDAMAFFRRCRESGNAELLFWEGLIEFFHRGHPDAGLDLLCSAAVKGHVVAKYAVSLAIFLHPVEMATKKQAVEWFHSVTALGVLRECMRLSNVVLLCPSWPEVQMPRIGDNLVCESPCCLTRGKTRCIYTYYRGGRSNQHWRCYEGSATLSCIKCRTDYELIWFVNYYRSFCGWPLGLLNWSTM